MSLPDAGRSGSWEDAPHTRHGRRRSLIAAGAILIAGIAVAVAVAVAVATRSAPGGTLAVGPSSRAEQRAERPAGDQAAFRLVDLEPLEVVNERAGNGPVVPDTTARSILATTAAGLLHVIDIASGDRRTLRLPDALAHEQLTTMSVVGDDVILGTSGQVVRLSGEALQPIQVATNHVALRTHAESSLWMLSLGQDSPTRNAVRIRLDGTIEREIALPAIIGPSAGTSEALVVSVPGGVNVIRNDSGGVVGLPGHVAAVGDDRLARIECTSDLVCQVIIGTFDDPDRARVPLTPNDVPGSYYGTASGLFSPDGRWLALPLHRTGPGSGLEQTAVAMIDTTVGAEVGRVRGSANQQLNGDQVVWTPDSRWLVLASSAGLSAWDARQHRTVVLDVAVFGANGLVVR